MTYIEPVVTLLVVLLAAAFLRRRAPDWGRRAAGVAAAILFAWSWPPVVQILAGTLEGRYAEREAPLGDAEAIVVLAAGLRAPDAGRLPPELDESSYLRTRHAAWLYRNWKPAPVLVCGGPMGPRGRRVAAAGVMRSALIDGGVPAERIWVEGRSSNTYENAAYGAGILREKGVRRVALVTEAYHMLRAERCFRRQGIEVAPAPCGFYGASLPPEWEHFVPSPRAMVRNEKLLHEWAGLVAYWLAGRL
jgi:uncharacterized SAM-binding protein YcdF (DUF218 family)